MNVADMHCDTVSEIYDRRRAGKPTQLSENELHIDLNKMERGGYLLQNFALFTHLGETETPYEYCTALAQTFKAELAENAGRITQAVCFADIERARAERKIAAVLTVEEGEAYEGSFEKLDAILSYGVKMSTLTWNYENSLAYPNTRPDGKGGYTAVYNTEQGLKPLGVEFARELCRRGVVLDVSHLSDGGFWDIVKYTDAPFCASHSNARAVCPHPRNLTDDMLRALADRGGVAGINYFAWFLNTDNPQKQSRVADMIAHIKHMRKVAGIGVIGLGSDFDGIGGELELADGSYMPLLAQALEREGFTCAEIEAIFCGNVLRLYREVWK